MKRNASARWNGSLQQGQGSLSTATSTLQNMAYSFSSRFADGRGTNPEELIAAAHAGCFAMALSGLLGKEGFQPQTIEATATVTIEKTGDDWSITSSHLTVQGQVPGIDEQKFSKLAEIAKTNCPVSKALKVPLSLSAHLKNARQSEASL